MGVFSLFSSKGTFDPDTFEKELTSITESISSNKQQIYRLKQRQKLLRKSIARYMSLFYICIVSYFYLLTPSERAGKNRIQWFVINQSRRNLLILIGYPLLAILLSKGISFVFQFFINNKENSLKNLQKKHKVKIEELKNITNFNKTNELINKYGDEKPPKNQVQEGANKGQQRIRNRKDNSKSIRQQALKELNLPEQQQTQQEIQGTVGQHLKEQKVIPDGPTPSPIVPQQPVPRTFQDRILDILIGSDNSEAVESRYALICFNCFSHNGLAPPHTEDPANIKFQCWKCGAMNGKGMLFDQPELTSQSPIESSPEAIKTSDSKAPEPVPKKEEGATKTDEI